MLNKINLQEKFQLFNEYWTPKILGQLNDSYVKIFKAKGQFVWHHHENEDEFFLVIKGQLIIKMKNQEVILNSGDCFIVPRGIKHLPYSLDEAYVLLLEPINVLNTGNTVTNKTVKNPDKI